MKIKSILFLILILIIILGAIALVVFFEFKYSDKFYPGITINNISVAGKTYEQVLQEFKTKSDALKKDGLKLVFNKTNSKKEINIPEATTGLTPDTNFEYFSVVNFEPIISGAFSWGRKGNFSQRIEEQYNLIYKKNFAVSVSAHKEAIESLVSRETKYFLTAGTPAQFAINSTNDLVIIPEKLGDDLNVEKIIDSIVKKFDSFEINPIIFNINSETPYPTENNLKPFLGALSEFSKVANANFIYQKNKWHITGKTLATWLTLKTGNQLVIDRKKVELFISTSISPLIDDQPQNSRFEMKNGKIIEIYPGKSGYVVDVDKAVSLIEKIIPKIQQSFIKTNSMLASIASVISALVADNSEIKFDSENSSIDITIEVIKVEPEITQKTIDKYKIRDLIGHAETNFSGGSLDRQHNIETGVSKLTGILIAPGEEFSTVENIGEVTEEAGFRKEYVIKGNQTVKELGGGLCQVATTLFRTVLNAGLPVTERANHQYVIPYYGPGLDATIYGPHPDFRFINDTGNYILLQGQAIDNEVIFELYGVDDGRKIEISKPKLYNERPVPATRYIMDPNLPIGKISCETVTHKGITADATYTVNYLDGSKREQFFHSVYQPWPKVCVFGTAKY